MPRKLPHNIDNTKCTPHQLAISLGRQAIPELPTVERDIVAPWTDGDRNGIGVFGSSITNGSPYLGGFLRGGYTQIGSYSRIIEREMGCHIGFKKLCELNGRIQEVTALSSLGHDLPIRRISPKEF
jgi:hypothetical protein